MTDWQAFDTNAPKRYAKAIEAGCSEHLYAAPIAFEYDQSHGETYYDWLLRNGRYTMYVPPTEEQIMQWMNEWLNNGGRLGE